MPPLNEWYFRARCYILRLTEQGDFRGILQKCTRLAKGWEILIFPRTVGNTGNSRELLVIPGNYWEISYSLTKKLLIYLLTAIQLYLQCKNNHYNSTFYQMIK